MVHYKRYSPILAALGVILASLAPSLPDTTTGSPRAIAAALATGLVAAAVMLRGRD